MSADETPDQKGVALGLRLRKPSRPNALRVCPLLWATATAMPSKSGSEEKQPAA